MSTIKVINLVGESRESWEEAVKNAVKEASRTIDDIVGIEVLNNTATVEDGQIVDFKSNVHLAFKVNN